MRKKLRYYCLIGIIIFLFPVICCGQGSVGLPFLKMITGARQSGMGNVFTGVGDDLYTLYTNPGGLGHIRRWQWSAAYNKYFTDIYQANLTYIKQVRILGSRKTTLGLGSTYLGMPSWDSTGGKESPVSAGHLLVSVALGQRLDWIYHALAFGINVKGISSRFDTYSAQGVAADMGFLLKPDRFGLGAFGMGIFDYGIITCGVSLLHLGTEMKFDGESTLLPKTWRAGLSLHLGAYRNWSVLLATDFVGVRDRDWTVGVGTEIWWREMVGMRFGYGFNKEDLGDFTFGLGLRWNNVMNTMMDLPSHYGDALELDMADVGYGDVLQETYRGTLSHYSIAPEPFRLEEPEVVTSQEIGEASRVELIWEDAFDPDPFDEVQYIVLIDKNRSKIERAIDRIERGINPFLSSSLRDSLLVCAFTPATSYVSSVDEGGIYHWAIVAYDLDHHAQLAKKGREKIGQFIVATPDLVVKDFMFTPSTWITKTPEQGMLSFVVANEGDMPSIGFRFIVKDLSPGSHALQDTTEDVLLDTFVSELYIGEDTTFQVAWSTSKQGLHIIQTFVDADTSVLEINKENNIRRDLVVSIPKGEFTVPDTVEVVATGYDYTEIPVVPEIYFAPFSSQVDPFYINGREILPPILKTLAQRLKKFPDVTLKAMGAIDLLSGEEDTDLADERAESVRNVLIEMGVPAFQVVVERDHPDKILGDRPMPVDPQDAKWVMEQNRVVTFSCSQINELDIFGPHNVAVDTTIRDTVLFRVDIISPAHISEWQLEGQPRSILVTQEDVILNERLWGTVLWNGTDQTRTLVPRNSPYQFALTLTDTLGRSFNTRPHMVYLKQRRTIRRREVFGAAKFAQTEPVFQFYWDRLMDIATEMVENPKMNLVFEGHACTIGPDYVNDRLSYQRALRFSEAFVERVKEMFPDTYQQITQRIEAPEGYGEKEPLRLQLKGGEEVLLGDNNTPVGRYLNRRIMVLLFQEY
ncbi:PorV/PorQ family protein [bacterium]|nr:PorV/PorQ family protein [bacterium]RQV93771.1 MAG: PorV/PorQ family protein [bacterium]